MGGPVDVGLAEALGRALAAEVVRLEAVARGDGVVDVLRVVVTARGGGT